VICISRNLILIEMCFFVHYYDNDYVNDYQDMCFLYD
jgi:hypothetical protein